MSLSPGIASTLLVHNGLLGREVAAVNPELLLRIVAGAAFMLLLLLLLSVFEFCAWAAKSAWSRANAKLAWMRLELQKRTKLDQKDVKVLSLLHILQVYGDSWVGGLNCCHVQAVTVSWAAVLRQAHSAFPKPAGKLAILTAMGLICTG